MTEKSIPPEDLAFSKKALYHFYITLELPPEEIAVRHEAIYPLGVTAKAIVAALRYYGITKRRRTEKAKQGALRADPTSDGRVIMRRYSPNHHMAEPSGWVREDYRVIWMKYGINLTLEENQEYWKFRHLNDNPRDCRPENLMLEPKTEEGKMWWHVSNVRGACEEEPTLQALLKSFPEDYRERVVREALLQILAETDIRWRRKGREATPGELRLIFRYCVQEGTLHASALLYRVFGFGGLGGSHTVQELANRGLAQYPFLRRIYPESEKLAREIASELGIPWKRASQSTCKLKIGGKDLLQFKRSRNTGGWGRNIFVSRQPALFAVDNFPIRDELLIDAAKRKEEDSQHLESQERKPDDSRRDQGGR